MGAYVYKLSGIRNYLELNIEGKQELVYQIEYWWKPSWNLKGDECKPRTYNKTVAASLGEDNAANKMNKPDKETLDLWNKLKRIGNIYPKINYRDLVYIGCKCFYFVFFK